MDFVDATGNDLPLRIRDLAAQRGLHVYATSVPGYRSRGLPRCIGYAAEPGHLLTPEGDPLRAIATGDGPASAIMAALEEAARRGLGERSA